MKFIGANIQVIEVELGSDETVIAEAGANRRVCFYDSLHQCRNEETEICLRCTLSMGNYTPVYLSDMLGNTLLRVKKCISLRGQGNPYRNRFQQEVGYRIFRSRRSFFGHS